MNHNIWEIVNLNDLVKILKDSPKKFVIVGITLNSTPEPIAKMIKKFLKVKSKIYPNITFLYYRASDSDLGRISLLVKAKEDYPYIYHIYDTSNIFVSVNAANEQTTYEAFAAVEEYYKKDLTNNTGNNSSNTNHNVYQEDNSNQMNIVNEEEAELEQQRQMIEQKKTLEKILLLQKKAKDYNIKFLETIQDRKKRENKK
jgi:hypothetical protein